MYMWHVNIFISDHVSIFICKSRYAWRIQLTDTRLKPTHYLLSDAHFIKKKKRLLQNTYLADIGVFMLPSY